LILGLAGAMAWLPSLSAQQKDPDEAGVAEAIRYERAKQAAADRQARIEARTRRKIRGSFGFGAEAQSPPGEKRGGNSQGSTARTQLGLPCFDLDWGI
jgi:hypothetical protein